jgi:small neutral amino acid transporter SnatA (MarC family)
MDLRPLHPGLRHAFRDHRPDRARAALRGAHAGHGRAPQRRKVAVRACLVALGLLTLFGLAGEAVLGFLGISMPAFRIAGGVLLCS